MFSSCSKYVNYKSFILKTEKLNQNVLLKAGFYYSIDTKKGFDHDSVEKSYELYFFYDDGTFGSSCYRGNNIESFGKKLSADSNFRGGIKLKMDKFKEWGKYQITDNHLLIQSFELYSEIKYSLYEHIGTLTSDTSLIITKAGFYPTKNNMGSEIELKKPIVFKFYQCLACKPDSTNWLQKK